MPPARIAERISGNVTKRNVWLPWAPRSGGRLEQVEVGAAQPGDDVVVGEDDAERGVGDDERVEAETDAELERPEIDRARERVLQGDAGDDPRQGDREDEQERVGVAPEEAEALHREGGERAEDEGDRRPARRVERRDGVAATGEIIR